MQRKWIVASLGLALVAAPAKAGDTGSDPVHDAREREVHMWYPPPMDNSVEQDTLVSVVHFGPDLYVHWHVAKKMTGAHYKSLPGNKGFLVAPSHERPKPGTYALYSRSRGRKVADCQVSELVSIVSGAKDERHTLNPTKSIYVPGECGELRFLWGKLDCSEHLDVAKEGEGLTDFWLLPNNGVVPTSFSEVPTTPALAAALRKDVLRTPLLQNYLAEKIKSHGMSKFYVGCPAPVVVPHAVRTFRSSNRTVAFAEIDVTSWRKIGSNPNGCSEMTGSDGRAVLYDIAADGSFKATPNEALAFAMKSDTLMEMPDGGLARLHLGDGKTTEEAELSHVTFGCKDNNWTITHTIVWKLCEHRETDE